MSTHTEPCTALSYSAHARAVHALLLRCHPIAQRRTSDAPCHSQAFHASLKCTYGCRYICAHLCACVYVCVTQGELTEPIKPDDSLWNIDGNVLEFTLAKADGMHWWSAVLKGDEPIDVHKVEPENSKLSDLDAETRQVRKSGNAVSCSAVHAHLYVSGSRLSPRLC